MVEERGEKYCKSLKYAEKASRLLDHRYYNKIVAAVKANPPDKTAFINICTGPLGIPEEIANDLWSRITFTPGPTEHW